MIPSAHPVGCGNFNWIEQANTQKQGDRISFQDPFIFLGLLTSVSQALPWLLLSPLGLNRPQAPI